MPNKNGTDANISNIVAPSRESRKFYCQE